MNAKSSNGKLLVKQVRGGQGGRTQRVQDTLSALGLGKIGRTVELPLNPAVAGMIRRVAHLVQVELR